MTEFVNPDYLYLEDNVLKVGTQLFKLDDYILKVIVERIPILDGKIFANNKECEILYVKKQGVWYSLYNFGHRRATENADTWDHAVNVTDDWVRDHCYELQSVDPNR